MTNLQNRLDNIEDYSRKNNIRIDGIAELPNETNEVLHVKVKKLLEEKLQIQNVNLDNIHRLSANKRIQGAPRTIITRFSNQWTRDNIMKKKMKLKGTGIFLNEDVSENTLLARRDQMDLYKQAKSSGKIAFFNGKRLIIRERKLISTTNSNQQGTTSAGAVSELINTFTPKPCEDENAVKPETTPLGLKNRLRSNQP